MKEKTKTELKNVIGQLSLPHLIQVLSFAKAFLNKQIEDIKDKE